MLDPNAVDVTTPSICYNILTSAATTGATSRNMTNTRATYMKAVVTTGDGGVVLKTDVLVPTPGPGQILVKVVAAAQNPSEWMTLAFINTPDIVLGRDFAGIVEEIGPDVPHGLRVVGERVAGFINGAMTKELGGTFAEYCLAEAQILVTIPATLSFEDAAGIGLAGFTACQALWQNQDLPTPLNPTSNPFPILIWGGASAVGQYAVQLAKLSGLQVITTASPKNHELLKGLGADAVFDYRDPEVSNKIRQFSGDKLAHAVDCIATGDTPALVSTSFGSDGGYVALVMPGDIPRTDVKGEFSLVYTLFGKAFDFPMPYPAYPKHFELGKKFGIILNSLLRDERLKTTPVKLVPNGLVDAQKWIQYQKDGNVSAEKITYRIGDTL
ncbi:chaperonin 10-like protein [Collybia nuda]|uniref:Chaperonin 10-like protein n=1 Tax=Collybia nuda TaxID=64659 RepID=A0A9P5YC33_9AGAR|nr:chaperonin 10-like protein [Collybia nuda]